MTCEEYVIDQLREVNVQNEILENQNIKLNSKLDEVTDRLSRILEIIQKYAEVEPEKLYLTIYGWKSYGEETADFKEFVELCELEVKENEDEPSSIDG